MNRHTITLVIAFFVILVAAAAHAYDATYTFTQPSPELVSGWKTKAGPTPGGPYPSVVDCKKPAMRADNTYECLHSNVSYNPLYGVVSNYDSEGREMATSQEYKLAITAPAAGGLKIVVTIRTVSSFTSQGNITAKTTVISKQVPADTVVDTNPINYWNSKTKQYISQTTLVM